MFSAQKARREAAKIRTDRKARLTAGGEKVRSQQKQRFLDQFYRRGSEGAATARTALVSFASSCVAK